MVDKSGENCRPVQGKAADHAVGAFDLLPRLPRRHLSPGRGQGLEKNLRPVGAEVFRSGAGVVEKNAGLLAALQEALGQGRSPGAARQSDGRRLSVT